MKNSPHFRAVLGTAVFWICVSAQIVPATDIALPAGIESIQREDGRNEVRIGLGSATLVVDPLPKATGMGPQRTEFVVYTGDRDRPNVQESQVMLMPETRAIEAASPTATSITVRSGFTMGPDDRKTVVFDLGRRATTADAVIWIPQERTLVTGRLCDRTGVAATSESDTIAWSKALHDLLDLEPAIVIPGRGAPGGPDLLADQLNRLTALRAHVESRVLAGQTATTAANDFSAEWYRSWKAEAPESASEAYRTVFNEIAGLVPPWELLEERQLREGPPSTGSEAPGWSKPRKVLWRNSWPDRLAMLAVVAPGVEIVPFDDSHEALEAIAGADALIGTADADLLAAGASLRWVQVGSAGVERYLTIPKLATGEVVLTNGQRLASPVIAEHVMALTRALARGLNRAVSAQNAGLWQRSEIGDSAPLTTLRGKTLLVVGLGGIGTEVARLANAAGMRVTAIRNSRRSGPAFVARVGLGDDLPAYAGEADVVVNCLPMTPDTEDLFDEQLFAVMKPTAFFINVGRGGTVDTDALVDALVSGRIAGAGLDVTDPEPLPVDHPLWKAPNLIITPHFAAWSDDDSNLRWLLYRENLRRFAAGERLLSVVDPARGY